MLSIPTRSSSPFLTWSNLESEIRRHPTYTTFPERQKRKQDSDLFSLVFDAEGIVDRKKEAPPFLYLTFIPNQTFFPLSPTYAPPCTTYYHASFQHPEFFPTPQDTELIGTHFPFPRKILLLLVLDPSVGMAQKIQIKMRSDRRK